MQVLISCNALQTTQPPSSESRATSLLVITAPLSYDEKSLPPEWIDARQAKKIFCLGRTTLYNLAAAGKIKTVSLRERGKIRGKRLFSYDSIKELLERYSTQGAA